MKLKLQFLVLLSGLLVVKVGGVLNNSTLVGTTDCKGYKLTSITESYAGFQGKLQLIGKPCGMYSPDLSELALKVTYDSTRLRVMISDKDNKNLQVPQNILVNKVPPTSDVSGLKFEYTKDPFSFKVTRKSDKMVLFDTSGQRFVFQQEYIELSSKLPSNAVVYGIGEVVDNFRRNPNTTVHAMWARDVSDPVRENVYGTHPFYIELRDSKLHGVHMLNPYGMDVILAPNKVSYKALGGIIDLSIFEGPNHQSVMEQFTATFGRPHRINYWSLGFHQCRWGYKNLNDVQTVVDKYKSNKLHLETMWTDIDYMDGFRDFTFHPTNFPLDKFKQFVDKLHANHQTYVLIVDPAIQKKPGYEAYDLGKKLDVFLKNKGGDDYIGQVWPGYTVFPDWFHPKIQEYWNHLIGKFISDSNVDGIWIDMNEPASFCFGSCGTGQSDLQSQQQVASSQGRQKVLRKQPLLADKPQTWKEPNYAIHNHWGNLSMKTVATNAVHHNGLTEFQTHNLYGHMEALVTRNAMLNHQPNKRPFLLSRSTFTGSGAITGHWTGDNFSLWDYLYYSIPGVLSFNMFGVPFVGADICGFNNDATEELCARWMQLGSLYTFSRNHNAIWAKSQEPYLWPATLDASRRALQIRYQLIPYLYTLMEFSSRKGNMVWIPLIFKFPQDKSLIELDTQFMVGDALMVAPVLKQGANDVEVTFPNGRWYDYYTYNEFKGNSKVKVKATLKDHMPLFINGGNVLPIKVNDENMLTLYDQKDVPITLIVALDSNYKATGKFYRDDGTSLDVGDKFDEINFEGNDKMLKIYGKAAYQQFKVDKAIWIGLPKTNKVFENAKNVTTFIRTPTNPVLENKLKGADVMIKDGTLTVDNLNLNVKGVVDIQIYLF